MYIQKIHIENFRLLKNVDIVLDKSLTLIVGKNNTGKTSVAHLLQCSATIFLRNSDRIFEKK